MSTEFKKLQHTMKQIVKLAWDAQSEDLSHTENEELDNIIYKAMELGGGEDMTVSQFVESI